MKYKMCKECKYNKRPRFSYPCSRCDGKIVPLTCNDCRWQGMKRGIMICKDFEWD